MDFAEQVARDASSIGPGDVQGSVAAGCRTPTSSMSRSPLRPAAFLDVLDAVGAQADAVLCEDLEAALRAALTVGREPQPTNRTDAPPEQH